MDAVRVLGPMLVFELDFPDDGDFGMMSRGRIYPMSADAAGALAAGAMMLGDLGALRSASRAGVSTRGSASTAGSITGVSGHRARTCAGTGESCDDDR